jgi:hypothetical protein
VGRRLCSAQPTLSRPLGGCGVLTVSVLADLAPAVYDPFGDDDLELGGGAETEATPQTVLGYVMRMLNPVVSRMGMAAPAGLKMAPLNPAQGAASGPGGGGQAA